MKKRIRENFLNYWDDIKKSYNQGYGKLNTYFKFKTTFEFECYFNIKNQDKLRTLTNFKEVTTCSERNWSPLEGNKQYGQARDFTLQ